MILVCKTHGVRISIKGSIRRIEPPPGSYGNPCRIMTEPRPKPGKLGNCEIEEVA